MVDIEELKGVIASEMENSVSDELVSKRRPPSSTTRDDSPPALRRSGALALSPRTLPTQSSG